MVECKERKWEYLDIILITGDAYIDHPSFGVALIGRLLEHNGYKVAILSQPRFDTIDDFQQFGPPRLFFGITAGNLDSIVANYSGSGKVRDIDAYSTDGNPWRGKEKSKITRRRPDRATLIYANLAKAAFKDIPIVLGGVEASLRRFIHYDYKQNNIRGSVLSDAKADLIIYGMGEKAVLETAKRISNNQYLHDIAGTCERLTDREMQERFPNFSTQGDTELIQLPSWKEIQQDSHLFLEMEKKIDRHSRTISQNLLIQRQQSSWIVQYPSPAPLSSQELDALYELPFTRKSHPAFGEVPAYNMIRHSITIVRGCSGNCAFCAITRHQGPVVSSRSKKSVTREAITISHMEDFRGTITDLGGPTANLFGTKCNKNECSRHDCLYPKLCPHLEIDESLFLDLLRDVSAIEGVKHVFISSGLRMELLLKAPKLFKNIILNHTPGALKIAPEHTEHEVLRLMHKEPHSVLCTFVKECARIAKEADRKIHLTPYVITAHPGCSEKHMQALIQKMRALGLHIRQFQDFTPTPGTLSTAMYVTEKSPAGDTTIYVAKKQTDKQKQRSIVEKNFSMNKKSRKLAVRKRRRK